MKIFQFYHDKDLVGWTKTKETKVKYMLQRPGYKCRKVEYTTNDYLSFKTHHDNLEVFENVVNDKHDTVYLYMSITEADELDNLLYIMHNQIEDYMATLLTYPIKDNIMQTFADSVIDYKRRNNQLEYTFDTFTIFLKYIAKL